MARARRAWLILLCVALVVGGLSLPVAATLLDGRFGGVGLVVVQVAAAVGVCAGAGAALPEAASHPSTRARGAALGAALGLVAAVSSDFVLFVLLRG